MKGSESKMFDVSKITCVKSSGENNERNRERQ